MSTSNSINSDGWVKSSLTPGFPLGNGDRLVRYIRATEAERPLFATGAEWDSLKRAHEEIHTYLLRQNTTAQLNREFKNGITDEQLAKLVVFLREHDALCVMNPEDTPGEAQILCSLGLFQTK